MGDILTLAFLIAFGEIPRFSAVLLVLSFLAASVGFGRPPWFFGVGSGFAVGAMSVATILAYRHRLEALAGIQLTILLLHALRLSVFLIRREREPAFSRQMLARHTARPMRFGRRALVWVAVSWLYFCMFAPALFATVDRVLLIRPVTIVLQVLGIAVMLAGFALEVAADSQKSLFKAYQPEACCYSGLYGWVRQPNHFGELLFWIGNFIAGIGFYLSPMHYVIALTGIVGAVALLLIVTLRLEASRAMQYGGSPEYDAYVASVPVIIPWLSPRLFSPRTPQD